jgi:CRISPR system Cascade subunit CasB
VDAWPVVASLGGEIGQPGESVHVDIAALFAAHPEESSARNFGETCRAIALADSSDNTLPESHERRFRRLIASSDPSDLVDQLRSWVRLAGSKGVGVNYESLFADLWNWRWYTDDIRVQWARSFWRSGSDAEDAAKPETPNEPATV